MYCQVYLAGAGAETLSWYRRSVPVGLLLEALRERVEQGPDIPPDTRWVKLSGR